MEIFLIILLGIILGIFSGLIPGFHPNNIIPFIFIISSYLGSYNSAILIFICGIVNCFISFIPSIYFGIPEESSTLSILPGHKLFILGEGYTAIKLIILGGVIGLFISIFSLPLLFLFLPSIYFSIRPFIHILLLLSVFFMIWKEEKPLIALVVFNLSGILGYFSLNEIGDSALLPLLSGFFGLPIIFESLKRKNNLQEQIENKEIGVNMNQILTSSGQGVLSGLIAGILPGFGITQSIILVQSFLKTKIENNILNIKKFLISLGAANSSDIFYSILAILLISNPRSGIAIAIQKLINLNYETLIVFILIFIFIGIFSAIITYFLAKKLIKTITKINYSKLLFLVLIYLIFVVYLFSNFLGILILICATIIGMLPIKFGVNRTHTLGCLILPTVIFYLYH
ncbi:MAG: tripartite tricarboxylate transporter permease [Candidatus Aenigmatarchaeota archaeon]|nr:tripartite tricarboxylate transporter permease [Candidatus Aenigmarchaeota archaeon]